MQEVWNVGSSEFQISCAFNLDTSQAACWFFRQQQDYEIVSIPKKKGEKDIIDIVTYTFSNLLTATVAIPSLNIKYSVIPQRFVTEN